MQVDFYQLSQTPVEGALPQIAAKALATGARLLVVSGDAAQRAAISDALWAKGESFLAHGMAADAAHAARQPILLSDRAEPANGARMIALADGVWRDEADNFDRTFLFFDAATIDAARACWRNLGERDGVERRFWRQEGGRWLAGP